jgi:prepilin-type N-terminal cleavage/methylation domain-containing protein
MESCFPEKTTRAADPRRRGSLRRAGFTLMEVLVVVVIIAAVAALIVSNVDGVQERAEAAASRATMKTLREALMGSAAGPGYVADMKHLPGFDLGKLQPHDLLFEPSQEFLFQAAANRGWRGPYLRNAQGVANTNKDRGGRFPASGERRFDGDATFLDRGFFMTPSSSPYGVTDQLTVADPWGNPIVIQVPPPAAFSAPTDAKRLKYTRLVSAGPDGYLNTPLDRLAGMLPDGTATVREDDVVLFLDRADTYDSETP